MPRRVVPLTPSDRLTGAAARGRGRPASSLDSRNYTGRETGQGSPAAHGLGLGDGLYRPLAPTCRPYSALAPVGWASAVSCAPQDSRTTRWKSTRTSRAGISGDSMR